MTTITEKLENLKNVINIYKRTHKKKPILKGEKLLFVEKFPIIHVVLDNDEIAFVTKYLE